MEGLTVAGLTFKPRPLQPPIRSVPIELLEISHNTMPGETRGGAQPHRDQDAPCQWDREEEEETQKSESQSAVGEEWEVRKNKKQQIKGIIRGTGMKGAVLNCIDLLKEMEKLPSHNLAAGRRALQMRGGSQFGCQEELAGLWVVLEIGFNGRGVCYGKARRRPKCVQACNGCALLLACFVLPQGT